MKKLLPVIVLFFISCKGEKNQNEVWHDKMESYWDSSSKYSDIINCLFKCDKYDSAAIVLKTMVRFNDSSTFYYKLIYPNGNPCCGNFIKQPENKCNCK